MAIKCECGQRRKSTNPTDLPWVCERCSRFKAYSELLKSLVDQFVEEHKKEVLNGTA